MKTQYQKEREAIIKNGGDLKEFEDQWHARACDAYRKIPKTQEAINDFRCGKFII